MPMIQKNYFNIGRKIAKGENDMVAKKIGRILLIMFGISLFFGACTKQSQKNAITFGKPLDVAFDDGTPIWRGLTVGKARRENVLSTLGTPEKTWSFGDMEVLRYLPQGYKRELYDTNTYYKLILQQDVVQVILIEVWGYRYEELLKEMGAPEQIVDYATQRDVAIFATRGMAAVFEGLPSNYAVAYLQYYAPTSLEGYMAGWGRFHPEELPWQKTMPANINGLGFVPGKTLRREVEDLFGQPDFEWMEGDRQIYYYHVPGTVSGFDRFIFQQDTLTWMNIKVRDRYSIDEAIRNLGQVSTVIRLYHPPDVAKPIQYYCWPERGIVLIAEMKENYNPVQPKASVPDPNIRPNGADVVIARVQFEPLPLDTFLEQRLDRQITEEIHELH